jgi:hypothetical protein
MSPGNQLLAISTRQLALGTQSNACFAIYLFGEQGHDWADSLHSAIETAKG